MDLSGAAGCFVVVGFVIAVGGSGVVVGGVVGPDSGKFRPQS